MAFNNLWEFGWSFLWPNGAQEVAMNPGVQTFESAIATSDPPCRLNNSSLSVAGKRTVPGLSHLSSSVALASLPCSSSSLFLHSFLFASPCFDFRLLQVS